MLTGRYQERLGYEFDPKSRDKQQGVSLNEIILPQAMKAASYATGMVGRWHLGQPRALLPRPARFRLLLRVCRAAAVYIIDPKPGDASEGAGSDGEINDVDNARPLPTSRT
jgi:arylsulfatase A-like enzyme